jgi:hypothetical protein
VGKGDEIVQVGNDLYRCGQDQPVPVFVPKPLEALAAKIWSGLSRTDLELPSRRFVWANQKWETIPMALLSYDGGFMASRTGARFVDRLEFFDSKVIFSPLASSFLTALPLI